MGFYKSLGRIGGKAYKGIHKGFHKVVRPLYNIARKGLAIGEHIDNLLKLGENLPFAGEIIADVRASPQYHEVRAAIDTGGDLLDRGVVYLSRADKLAQQSLDYLARNEGGEVDVALTKVGEGAIDTFKSGRTAIQNSGFLQRSLFGMGGMPIRV